jgi:hypothetical protein
VKQSAGTVDGAGTTYSTIPPVANGLRDGPCVLVADGGAEAGPEQAITSTTLNTNTALTFR